MFKPLSVAAMISLAVSAQGASDGAERLAQRFLIVDTHIDVPYRLEHHYDDVTRATKTGDFDYPRATICRMAYSLFLARETDFFP